MTHSHSHGLIDRAVLRSRDGVKAVSVSLGILGATALVQVAIFALSASVALLADLIHNLGDALTAVPLGVAFFFRSFRGEKIAGLFVVLVIFVSACVALYETILRLIDPPRTFAPWGSRGRRLAGLHRQRTGRAGASQGWPAPF